MKVCIIYFWWNLWQTLTKGKYDTEDYYNWIGHIVLIDCWILDQIKLLVLIFASWTTNLIKIIKQSVVWCCGGIVGDVQLMLTVEHWWLFILINNQCVRYYLSYSENIPSKYAKFRYFFLINCAILRKTAITAQVNICFVHSGYKIRM